MNLDLPYEVPATAAMQTMQQPQSGPPSTTGGVGLGTGGLLPQCPGLNLDQAGSKSLPSLVDALQAAMQGDSSSSQIAAAMQELRVAAVQADEELKQTGNPQYPAPPPPTKMKPLENAKTQ